MWILENLGPCPEGMELDRKNNNGHYEPGNMRWATRQKQMQNTRAALAMKFLGNPIPKEHALHVVKHLVPNTRYADQTIRRFLHETKSVEATAERLLNAPPSFKPVGLYGTFSTPDPAIVSLYLES